MSRRRQAIVARLWCARDTEVTRHRRASTIFDRRVNQLAFNPVAVSRIGRLRSLGVCWSFELCEDWRRLIHVRERRVEIGRGSKLRLGVGRGSVVEPTGSGTRGGKGRRLAWSTGEGLRETSSATATVLGERWVALLGKDVVLWLERTEFVVIQDRRVDELARTCLTLNRVLSRLLPGLRAEV